MSRTREPHYYYGDVAWASPTRESDEIITRIYSKDGQLWSVHSTGWRQALFIFAEGRLRDVLYEKYKREVARGAPPYESPLR